MLFSNRITNLTHFFAILALCFAQTTWASTCKKPCSKNVFDVLKNASDTISDNINITKKLQKTNPEKFQATIEKTTQEVLLPIIDVDNMIKHIIGRYHWKMASKSEQERFYKLFEQILLKEYTVFLLQTHDSRISFRKSRVAKDQEYVTINASADIGEDKPVKIVFYTRCTCEAPSKWQVIDITVDNMSYLDQYRLKYAATVRNKGLRGLNNKLEDNINT